uniref:Cytochrome P450 n=1 Tax=Kalanchoe fedtschenkoi TaxID=63787 RepID=A0A7N0VEI3_KALFE
MKDNSKIIKEATSKPINLSDNIIPRVHPHFHLSLRTYGKNLIVWLGPRPEVYIMEPELIKEVSNRIYDFQKPLRNPCRKLLANGLAAYEGDQWVKHRRLINPAFHAETLTKMMPAFHHSSNEMVSKWEKLCLASADGSCELDVWKDIKA